MYKYLSFPQNDEFNPMAYYTEENLFSLDEIDWILNNIKKVPFTEGVVSTDKKRSSIRKSSIKWLKWEEYSEFEWVYNRLQHAIERANKNWGFNLYTMPEPIQYTEYHNSGGHYNWHTDVGKGALSHRKVSITVQLSKPNEYEGGNLELLRGEHSEVAPRGLGTVVVFPSYMLHRVTEITKGTRKSLVLWVGGDHYK